MATTKDIFILPGGESTMFQIYPIEACRGLLRTYINLSGGECLRKRDYGDKNLEDSSIPLLDYSFMEANKALSFEKPLNDVRDFFHSSYIYNCYGHGKQVDLNRYKKIELVSKDKLVEYDANKLVTREINWNDVIAPKALPETENQEKVVLASNVQVEPKAGPSRNDDSVMNLGSRSVESQGSRAKNDSGSALSSHATTSQANKSGDDGSSSGNQKKSSSSNRSKTSSQKKRASNRSRVRQDYTHEESKAILGYLCLHDLHDFTGGNEMWKKMRKNKSFKKRTWQSLKEHFRRKILVSLDKFGCSQEDKNKFELAKEKRGEGKKVPINRKTRNSD